MRYLSVSLLVLFACCAAAQAEVVIDDFDQSLSVGAGSVNVTVLNDDIGGTRTITTNGNSSVVTGSGLFRANAVSSGGTGFITMVYDFATTLNLTIFSNQTLGLDLFRTVVGTMSVDLSVGSGAGAASSSFATFTVPPTVDGVSVIASDWAGTADLSAVDQLSLTFTPTAGSVIESTPNANITAAPEPTSMALLGLTGIGGFVIARRRRNKQKEDKEENA